MTEGRDLYRGYLEAGQALGVSNLGRAVSKMIVADHLMANFDRHTHNFGLMREVETLDRYRVAPLFDNGCGFYSRATTDELEHGRYLWRPIRFAPILLSSWRSWRTCRGTIRPHSTGSSMT